MTRSCVSSSAAYELPEMLHHSHFHTKYLCYQKDDIKKVCDFKALSTKCTHGGYYSGPIYSPIFNHSCNTTKGMSTIK